MEKNTGSAIRVPKNQPLPIKQMQQFVNNKKIEGKSSFTFKKFSMKKKSSLSSKQVIPRLAISFQQGERLQNVALNSQFWSCLILSTTTGYKINIYGKILLALHNGIRIILRFYLNYRYNQLLSLDYKLKKSRNIFRTERG